jgi:hypothetical protein
MDRGVVFTVDSAAEPVQGFDVPVRSDEGDEVSSCYRSSVDHPGATRRRSSVHYLRLAHPRPTDGSPTPTS